MTATPSAEEIFGTIPKMAHHSAARWGDAPAVLDGELTLSFADVASQSAGVTASLVASGVAKGDRIGLWAPNSASWIVAALGILGAGAWLVPLNTRYKADEVAYILNRSGARAVFAVDDFMGVDYRQELYKAGPELDAITVIPLPGPGMISGAEWERFLSAGHGWADAAEERIASGGPDDISDLIFTSGTTGRPKGVMLRHGTSLRCYESLNSAYGLAESGRHLITTPFFHCFGYKAGWMLSLMTGAATVPLAVFDPAETLDLIARHRVTHMPGAPTIFSSLMRHPDRARYDLTSLQVGLVSAANIPEDLPGRMVAELGFRTVMSGYGLTENHAIGAFTRPEDPLVAVSSTVGRPAPGVEVRIVDDQGAERPRGEAGELLLGGYAHMSGYYHDEAATAEAIRDGWLHTGDIALVDADGYLHITDRKKDIFIMGGFNVAPAEVEATLRRIEGVSDVAVIGVPDSHFGEVGAAFVVRRPGSELTAEDVVGFAREHLANFKVPRRVEFVESLPTNATGKVTKHVLRQIAAGQP